MFGRWFGPRPPCAGIVVAEWFGCPARLEAVGVPVAAGGGAVLAVVLSEAGEVRRARVALDGGRLSLSFAALATGGRAALLLLDGARPEWEAPTPALVRRVWAWLLRRVPIAVSCNEERAPEPEPAPMPGVLTVERFWREGGGCYLSGWAHAGAEPVAGVAFEQADGPLVEAVGLRPRPDLLPHYPELPDGARAGFEVRLPLHDAGWVRAMLRLADGRVAAASTALPRAEADGSFAWGDPDAAMAAAEAGWARFVAAVTGGRLEVLEVGARVVAMGSSDMRPHFAGAGRYAGLDIHPAPGLDYVGDAHALTSIVGEGAFDAIFSSAVLEHLAMPWVAAGEMRRALRPGGLVFHRTHQSWPIHERPNDFFRFSDAALRVLFGPAHGFEVLDAGMAVPMALYPRRKGTVMDQTGLNPGFGMSWVLARAVEGGGAADVGALSRSYPVAGRG